MGNQVELPMVTIETSRGMRAGRLLLAMQDALCSFRNKALGVSRKPLQNMQRHLSITSDALPNSCIFILR